MNLKPFDLEKAKAGAKVVTRDGREVRIVCFDFINTWMGASQPIVFLLKGEKEEVIHTAGEDGRLRPSIESKGDLCMATVKKKGWINIYQNSGCVGGSVVYATKEDAEKEQMSHVIDCIEIEYIAE